MTTDSNPMGPATSPGDDEYERVRAERDKTFEALLLFIDWRHKIMIRFMVASAAFAAGWHYLDGRSWQLQALDLLAGSFFAGVMARMDTVNAGHLTRLYERGAWLEQQMFGGVGVFGAIRNKPQDAARITSVTGDATALAAARTARGSRGSYTWLIAFLYWTTSGVFLVGAGAMVVRHLCACK